MKEAHVLQAERTTIKLHLVNYQYPVPDFHQCANRSAIIRFTKAIKLSNFNVQEKDVQNSNKIYSIEKLCAHYSVWHLCTMANYKVDIHSQAQQRR